MLELLFRRLVLMLTGAALLGPLAARAASLDESSAIRAVAIVKQLPRPRTWPAGAERDAIFAALRNGSRADGFTKMVNNVTRLRAQQDSITALQAPRNDGQFIAQKQRVDAEARQAQSAAFAWLVARLPEMREEGRRRALALAALDPRGATSVEADMLSSRHVAWSLALALDWMHDAFSPDERSRVVKGIAVRVADFHQRMTTGKTAFDRWPWDSRANEVLGGMAESALLLLGEVPEAETWARDLLALYLRTTLVYAGNDGGYASGTAYAGWDIGEYSLRHWDSLRRMANIDMRDKPWVNNFGRFLVYFLPPGTPTGAFGDGAEERLPEVWARYAKAYAARVPTPLHRWYARQWFQEDVTALELLTAPPVDFDQVDLPTGNPPSAVFESIGWVAMHSDLRDRGRLSIYFKSSPFGSLNHSHADQNSFFVNMGGRPLLIDSGYYDSYNSAHQITWGRQTKAHNAITFDEGKGQILDRKEAAGRIRHFSDDGTLAVATGDAASAYGGGTRRALRTLLYFRPGILAVVDEANSVEARRWEINLHAPLPFRSIGDSVMVANGEAKACVTTRSPERLEARMWSGFPQTPARSAGMPRIDQHHARWSLSTASKGFLAVQIIDFGCTGTEVAVRFDAGSAIVSANDISVAVRDGTAKRLPSPLSADKE